LKCGKHDVVPGFSFRDVSRISDYHSPLHSKAQPESWKDCGPMQSTTTGLIERIMTNSRVGDFIPGAYHAKLFGTIQEYVFPTKQMCRQFVKRIYS
jgi:hypothetical protein